MPSSNYIQMSKVSSRSPASTGSENDTHARNNRPPSMTGPGPLSGGTLSTGPNNANSSAGPGDSGPGTGTGSPNGRRKASGLDLSSDAKIDTSADLVEVDDPCDSATPPASPAGSSDRGSRACCFCWCCCCSCSCILRNGEDRRNQASGTNLENLNTTDTQPTKEELYEWSESFDNLMSAHTGQKLFREFLRSEYSEENMLFWLACEELKTERNAEAVEEKARLIYEDYISILSPKEVSLDSRVREIINRNMVEPSPHTFDEAQLQIYTLMHRDSYPRFLNSQVYKKLVQSMQNS